METAAAAASSSMAVSVAPRAVSYSSSDPMEPASFDLGQVVWVLPSRAGPHAGGAHTAAWPGQIVRPKNGFWSGRWQLHLFASPTERSVEASRDEIVDFQSNYTRFRDGCASRSFRVALNQAVAAFALAPDGSGRGGSGGGSHGAGSGGGGSSGGGSGGGGGGNAIGSRSLGGSSSTAAFLNASSAAAAAAAAAVASSSTAATSCYSSRQSSDTSTYADSVSSTEEPPADSSSGSPASVGSVGGCPVTDPAAAAAAAAAATAAASAFAAAAAAAASAASATSAAARRPPMLPRIAPRSLWLVHPDGPDRPPAYVVVAVRDSVGPVVRVMGEIEKGFSFRPK